MKKIVFLVFICIGLNASAQKLSSTEKKIIDAVNKQLPQTFKTLEEVVNINSGTMNVKGISASGEVLRSAFEKMGFTVEWIKMPDSIKTAGHFVAVKKGGKGKKILMLAHLDTVFEPDMPSNPFKILNDSTATGQGILDDKGGAVLVLAALEALNQAGALKDANITVYFTGDEEVGGIPSVVTRADIIEKAKQHDVALSFEGGQINKVTTSRRGADNWRLFVYGKQAHSSGVFSDKAGYGAIYEAVRIVDSFRTGLSAMPYLTFNPGVFAGGTTVIDSVDNVKVYGKDNIIASKATVMGDVRFLGEKQRAEIRTLMRNIVMNNNLNGTSAEILFNDGIPSMEPKEGNKKLFLEINKVNADMGLGEVLENDPMERGAGDISFIADHIPSIDGLGPNGTGSHAPGETINTKQYPLLIQRAAIFIYRLSQKRDL
ncbi:MAG: M20/M25/M40 family metallo-hydrolase [Agriterribacter sp.]